MRIHSSREERKLGRRLAWIKLILKFAKQVRKRRRSRFCNDSFYFGDDPASSLKLIAPYHRRLLIHVDANSWLERWIFCQGYYEPELADFLERSLKPGMVAIDVGANIGCHALVMASATGESGRVFGFEPNPPIYQRLRANICLNRLTNIEAIPASVSDRSGRQTLFVPLDSDYNQGLASLHRESLSAHCQRILVNAITLDEFVRDRGLERVDLLKIDVEGHEYQVLRGARQTLRQFRPTLVFEFSERQWANAGVGPEQVEHYLAEHGYELFVLREDFITSIAHGVSEECNLVAVPMPETSNPSPSTEIPVLIRQTALVTN